MKLLTAEQWDTLWEMTLGDSEKLADSTVKAILSDFDLVYEHEKDGTIITPCDHCNVQNLLETIFCQDLIEGNPKNAWVENSFVHFYEYNSLYLSNSTKENWALKLIKKDTKRVTTTFYYRDYDGKLFKKEILGISNVWGSSYVRYECIIGDLLVLMVPGSDVVNNSKSRITKKEWDEAMKNVNKYNFLHDEV